MYQKNKKKFYFLSVLFYLFLIIFNININIYIVYSDNNLYNVTNIDSVIINSTLQNMTIAYAKVINNILISGYAIYNGYYYYPPYNLTLVYDHLPEEIKEINVNPLYFNNDTIINFSYSTGIGYDIRLNLSPLNNSVIQLIDSENNGNYKSSFHYINVNNNSEGKYVLNATINDNKHNFYLTNATLILDKTPPYGNLKIKPFEILGFNVSNENYTTIRTVYLILNYSDNNVIDKCRYANENKNFTPWTFCLYTMIWTLSEDNGWKYVYVQLRDKAGNIREINASIYYNYTGAGLDVTPPNPAVIKDEGEYFHKNTLEFRWFNASDYETERLGLRLTYKYRLLENGTAITPYYNTNNTFAIINVTCNNNSNYTLELNTINPALLSSTSYSDGIICDNGKPKVNLIKVKGYNISGWLNQSFFTVYFNATDNYELKGYSYTLNRNLNSTPDNIIDTENNFTEIYVSSSGTFYFHVRAIDTALNPSNTKTIKLMIDFSPPLKPQFKENITTRNNSINISWQTSIDGESGINYYELYVCNYSNYTNCSLFITNKTYYNLTLNEKTYYVKIRSKNNANLYSEFDYSIVRIDRTPPEILFITPQGLVINNNISFIVKTNENSICFIKNDNLGLDKMFDITGKKVHYLNKIKLNNGNYIFRLICNDTLNNQKIQDVNVIVNNQIKPDNIELINNKTIYVNSKAFFKIKVSNSNQGINQLKDFKLYLDNRPHDFDYSDLSQGYYNISFIPNRIYKKMSIYVDGINKSFGIDIKINYFVIKIKGINNGFKLRNVIFNANNNRLFGLASYKPILRNENNEFVMYSDVYNKSYIFLTRKTNLNYIDEGIILGRKIDNFANYKTNKLTISTQYKDAIINNTLELKPGLYTLFIRNIGYIDDKSLIEINIK